MFQCMNSLAYTDHWCKGRQGFLDGSTFNGDYLNRLADRDELTERHFVVYFSDLLMIKLRSKLRSSQMIEDVKQETFRRLFEKIRRPDAIQQPDRLPALVNAICNNVLFEGFRAQH